MTDQDIYDLALQKNLAYFGIDSVKQIKKGALLAANRIVEFLTKQNIQSISIIINDNYSAKYALAIGVGLDTLKFSTKVYSLSRLSKIKDQTAQSLVNEISELSAKYLKIWQDCKSEDIDQDQSFIFALGEAKQAVSLREKDAIKRITHFNPVKINLEYPVKGFTWDLSVSFDYGKTIDAEVFKSGINTSLVGIGPGELEVVVLPNQRTHLSQNCKLTLITDKPGEYKLDKQKLWSMDVVTAAESLPMLLEKLKSADTIMIDLDSLYADLLLESYQKINPNYVLVEINNELRKVLVVKPAKDSSQFKLTVKDGLIALFGNEIFTNLPKQAKFNSSKSIQALGIDCAALLKYNHPWIGCIGGCVW